MIRPFLALYAGGMGAKGANFHYEVFERMGYGDVADKVQNLYLEGKKAEAAASIPLEMVEDVALVGPAGKIREELERVARDLHHGNTAQRSGDDAPHLCRPHLGLSFSWGQTPTETRSLAGNGTSRHRLGRGRPRVPRRSRVRGRRHRSLRTRARCVWRAHAPSATPGDERGEPASRPVADGGPITISDATMAGNWGLSLDWSDGHSTGIYAWTTLRRWIDERDDEAVEDPTRRTD